MGDATEMNLLQEGNVARQGPVRTGLQRTFMTIVLACIAVTLEIYYSICAGACSYLRGTIFGVNLEYVGIGYMVCIILLSILKKDTLLLVLLSAGVGIEFYLIGFQVWHNTYCLYCLAFAAIVFLLFAVNFKRDRTMLCVVSTVAALIFFSIFFKGSLAPTYSYTLQINPIERSLCESLKTFTA